MSSGVHTLNEAGSASDRSIHSAQVPARTISAHFRSISGAILSSARRSAPILPIDSAHEAGGRSHLTLWAVISWTKKLA